MRERRFSSPGEYRTTRSAIPGGGLDDSRRTEKVKPRAGYTAGEGALAQLGERRLCKPEVTGSIPVRSISRFLGRRVRAKGDVRTPRPA